MQQTFNDVLLGIILLYERGVKVGDILDVDVITIPFPQMDLHLKPK